MKPWNLKGKNAFITGGTKGIGLATVKQFVALGAAVAFAARTKSDVQKLEQQLQQQGHAAKGFIADMNEPEQVKELSDRVTAHFTELHVLVNNAGTNIRKAATDYTAQEYQKVLQINLHAPFHLTSALYKPLQAAGRASVINVASVAGTADVRSGAPYGMSKGGLLQLTRSLATELAAAGIRVNSISPWYTKTPLTESVLQQEERMEKILARTPLKRVAEPEEIASIISFLAMEHSSYITGQNLIADGGLFANALG